MPDELLRYPVGKFQPKESYSSADIEQCIAAIEAAPDKLNQAFQKLTQKQLDTPYREGGWTARQVLHHLADSHMHAYIRFKWTLTENSPTIKAYYEKLWAETYEVAQDPALSLNLLKALHAKWVTLLRSLTSTDLEKYFVHPETGKQVRLDRLMATYAWHGEHHLGHLKIILDLKS
jgi:uncharacterized damage-inducible protein DinB